MKHLYTRSKCGIVKEGPYGIPNPKPQRFCTVQFFVRAGWKKGQNETPLYQTKFGMDVRCDPYKHPLKPQRFFMVQFWDIGVQKWLKQTPNGPSGLEGVIFDENLCGFGFRFSRGPLTSVYHRRDFYQVFTPWAQPKGCQIEANFFQRKSHPSFATVGRRKKC